MKIRDPKLKDGLKAGQVSHTKGPNMKLLTRGHSTVAEAASTDKTRYALNSVYLEETKTGMKTVATNGHILAVVEDESGAFDPAQYPVNVIPTGNQNGEKSALVPMEVFVKAFRDLPKAKRTSIPILQTVAVAMGKTETTFGTTDLDSPHVSTAKNIGEKFPNYEQIIPKATTFTITFDPCVLGKALKMAKDFGLDFMKMEFTTDLNPVKITGKRNGQKLTIVVMPLRPT